MKYSCMEVIQQQKQHHSLLIFVFILEYFGTHHAEFLAGVPSRKSNKYTVVIFWAKYFLLVNIGFSDSVQVLGGCESIKRANFCLMEHGAKPGYIRYYFLCKSLTFGLPLFFPLCSILSQWHKLSIIGLVIPMDPYE